MDIDNKMENWLDFYYIWIKNKNQRWYILPNNYGAYQGSNKRSLPLYFYRGATTTQNLYARQCPKSLAGTENYFRVLTKDSNLKKGELRKNGYIISEIDFFKTKPEIVIEYALNTYEGTMLNEDEENLFEYVYKKLKNNTNYTIPKDMNYYYETSYPNPGFLNKLPNKSKRNKFLAQLMYAITLSNRKDEYYVSTAMEEWNI